MKVWLCSGKNVFNPSTKHVLNSAIWFPLISFTDWFLISVTIFPLRISYFFVIIWKYSFLILLCTFHLEIEVIDLPNVKFIVFLNCVLGYVDFFSWACLGNFTSGQMQTLPLELKNLGDGCWIIFVFKIFVKYLSYYSFNQFGLN